MSGLKSLWLVVLFATVTMLGSGLQQELGDLGGGTGNPEQAIQVHEYSTMRHEPETKSSNRSNSTSGGGYNSTGPSPSKSQSAAQAAWTMSSVAVTAVVGVVVSLA